MSWWNRFTEPFKENREADKNITVTAIIGALEKDTYKFTPSEKAEILNRAALRLFEGHKDKRDELIKKAREYQDSLKEIKL